MRVRLVGLAKGMCYTSQLIALKLLRNAVGFAGKADVILRRGGRVVEGARLESVYTAKPYRGFEPLPLRHFQCAIDSGIGGYVGCSEMF